EEVRPSCNEAGGMAASQARGARDVVPDNWADKPRRHISRPGRRRRVDHKGQYQICLLDDRRTRYRAQDREDKPGRWGEGASDTMKSPCERGVGTSPTVT